MGSPNWCPRKVDRRCIERLLGCTRALIPCRASTMLLATAEQGSHISQEAHGFVAAVRVEYYELWSDRLGGSKRPGGISACVRLSAPAEEVPASMGDEAILLFFDSALDEEACAGRPTSGPRQR